MEVPKTETKNLPKPVPNKRKPKPSQISKEKLELIVQKKKECNSKAQKIVEDLIEPIPSKHFEELKKKLKDISQAHYDDIVEERSITKLCGYILCSKVLVNIPNKQYHVSLTQKKVYDLTERKSFCSGQCFKASNYVKAQLLTTPLWTRKEDDVIPDFKLLDINKDEQVAKVIK